MNIYRNNTVLIFLLALLAGCGSRDASNEKLIRKVKLAEVCLADSLEQKMYPGIINEKCNVRLAFRVAGPIMELDVEEGDYIRKGELVAQIDPRDYEVQLKAARGQYEKVKTEAERVIELHERNSVAGNDYQKALAGLKMAEANLEHAKNQLDDTKLTAPVSGYIEEVNFTPGEMVDAGMPVVSLIDVTGYEVEVEIPVSMFARREDFVAFTGNQPSVQAKDFPLQLTGISKKANTNQLYTLQLKLNPSANPGLAPGMNAQVVITMRTGIKDLLCVPLNAVFEKNGHTYVWVFSSEKGVVKSRRVTTGELTGENLVTILSGLEAGEQVVSAGVHHLHENREVEVMEPASETNVGGML